MTKSVGIHQQATRALGRLVVQRSVCVCKDPYKMYHNQQSVNNFLCQKTPNSRIGWKKAITNCCASSLINKLENFVALHQFSSKILSLDPCHLLLIASLDLNEQQVLLQA